MSATPLRGSCHCGRNQYIVRVPSDVPNAAQIVFDTNQVHRISSAAPLSAFIRVPLSWYHSETFPFFPDETRSSIRRIYSHPSEQHTLRHFCGFCGTPISYWSEEPRSEADFIQLTVGSLLTQDLHNLEDLGLVPGDSDNDEMDVVEPLEVTSSHLIGRDFTSIPWFDGLLQGSQLGNMRTSKGARESRDGSMRVEWEITEWTAADDVAQNEAAAADASSTGKRKRPGADKSESAAADKMQ